MSDTRYLPATRRAPATMLLFLAVVACWAVWMGWDVHYDVDAVTGRSTGPYQPWQGVGCLVSLVAVVTAAARRLPFPTVLVTTPAAFTLAWSASAATSEHGDGLWPIGAVFLFVAAVGATVLVGGLADIGWTERRRRGRLTIRGRVGAGPRGHLGVVELLDDYTGHVDSGGPAARRDLDTVSIIKMSVSEMDNNVYLLVCRRTGEALLIDAADDAARILDTVDTVAARDRVTGLATTHKHWDHVRALPDVAGALSATTYAGELDAPELPVAPDRTVGDDDEVRFGDAVVGIIHLSGHTPGSIALAYRDPNGPTHLFTGDSLFPGGPGKTWSAEDHESLMDDLEHKIFSHFGDDTHVYPGHGDDTVLGDERPNLADWRARGW